MIKNKQECFLRNMIHMINSEDDNTEIIFNICKEIKEFFDIERVAMFEIPNQNGINKIEDYKPDKTLKKLTDVLDSNGYNKVVKYWKSLNLLKNDITIFERIENSKMDDWLKKAYKDAGIYSVILSLIENDDYGIKVVVLYSYKKDRIWKEDEISFIKVFSEYLSIVLKKENDRKMILTLNYQIKKILDNIPFSVWIKDTTGKFLYVNKIFLKYARNKKENIIDKTDFDFFPEEQAKTYSSEDIEVMKLKSMKKYPTEIDIGTEIIDAMIYKIPVLNLNGEVDFIVGIAQDVTEDKALERAKSDFISMVSHELRTPITSIIGGLQMIQWPTVTEDKKMQLVDIADKNAQRLLNLINNILDIEKIEANKVVYNYEVLSLNPIIKETCDEIETYADNVNIEFALETNDKCKVNVDKFKLIQVITNLLSNAIKYSNNKPIKVSTKINENSVQIIVTNYGEKIPEEFKSSIFNRFTQANTKKTGKICGTGLGLTISKSIVEAFNGEISFESDDNQTSFCIELPVVK